MSFSSKLGIVVVLSLALRVACVVLIPNAQYSDSVWYDAAAARLASLGEYGPGGPSAWFPPGYPFFLAGVYAVFGHVQLAGKLANAVLGAAACLLTGLLGKALAGERVGLLAAGVLAFWPNVIWHTLVLSSEPFAVFGFCATLWLGTRPPTPGGKVILGLVVGWTILARPVAVILFPVLGLFWWLRTGSIRQAAGVLAVPALLATLLIGCWTGRNQVRFGEPILIATNGGYNFWQVNHRFADGNDTYWPRVPVDDPEFRTMAGGDEFIRNRAGYRYGLRYLRDHPEHFVRLMPAKVFWLFHTDTSGWYEGLQYAPERTPSRVMRWLKMHAPVVRGVTIGYYLAVLTLALPAVVVTPAGERRRLLPLLALPLLLTAFHQFFHAKDRFHVPLSPVFALLAAVTLDRIWTWKEKTTTGCPLTH